MGSAANNPQRTLNERLTEMYRQSSPQANLQAFIDDYQKRYQFDLMWCEGRDRYLAVLDSMRAQYMMETLSRPDWNKLEMSLHRKKLEISQVVFAIGREQSVTVDVHALAGPSSVQMLKTKSARKTPCGEQISAPPVGQSAEHDD
jgi:hypothetical protein